MRLLVWSVAAIDAGKHAPLLIREVSVRVADELGRHRADYGPVGAGERAMRRVLPWSRRQGNEMAGEEVRFGVVYEAYRYWAVRWKEWLSVTIVFGLLGGLLAAIPFVAGNMILKGMLGQIPKGGEHYLAALPIRIPVWGLATAVMWALDVGVFKTAFRHLGGEPFEISDLISGLRLFWVFLLPAVFAQAVSSLAAAGALMLLTWPAVYLLKLAIEPFVAAPLLFVLPLMADKGWNLRKASRSSLAATGSRFLGYGAVYWLLQAVPYGTPLLLLLVTELAPLEGVAAFVLSVVFMPLPYIGVALLYKGRFPDPTPPPFLAES